METSCLLKAIFISFDLNGLFSFSGENAQCPYNRPATFLSTRIIPTMGSQKLKLVTSWWNLG